VARAIAKRPVLLPETGHFLAFIEEIPMKMKNRNYVMTVAMPHLVRLAIDDLRSRYASANDAELLGVIIRRGVKDMLDDEPEFNEPDRFEPSRFEPATFDPEPFKPDERTATVVAFPIPKQVNERLQRLLNQHPEEKEKTMAMLFDLGLSVFEDPIKSGRRSARERLK
jgi:hypothetical protein